MDAPGPNFSRPLRRAGRASRLATAPSPPVILAIVLVVLLLVLRSLVAAIVLVLTVVGTYLASMGASWFAVEHLFDFPPLAVSTPLLGFLFLVALGVDYNIFLATRAREEAAAGPRPESPWCGPSP